MPTVISPYDESWNDCERYAYQGMCWSRELWDHLEEWGVSNEYYTPVHIDEGCVEMHQDAWDEPPYPDFMPPNESIQIYQKYKCWGKGVK